MLKRIAIVVFALLIVGLSFINLDRVPSPWWDEGWTMNVARNWVERGVYGQLLNGKPAPPGLSASFPTVVSVAFSFKILGIGIFQARLVTVLYMLGCLGLLYQLAFKLFDKRIALAGLILSVFFAPDLSLNPIMTGRQVLAEMPMLFWLLLGYLGLWLVLNRSAGWLLLVIPVWGFALIAKAEPLPFWISSLILPVVILLLRKHWRWAVLITLALAGSLVMSFWWPHLIDLIVPGYSANEAVAGVVEVTALVLIPQVRLAVLALVAQIGLPALFGLVYAARRWLRQRELLAFTDVREIMRIAIWSLASSWFAWYVVFSRGTPRYAFPAVFVASMFVALLMRDVTGGFQFRTMLNRLARSIKFRQIDRRTVSGAALLALLLAMLAFSLQWLGPMAAQAASMDNPAKEAADYLNTQTSSTALIETYDSELFVLLNRRYHFPPDQISVDLIRNVTIANFNVTGSSPIGVSYNPLAANPDYIVVGPANELWRQLYAPILQTGALQRVYANRIYEVWQRMR